MYLLPAQSAPFFSFTGSHFSGSPGSRDTFLLVPTHFPLLVLISPYFQNVFHFLWSLFGLLDLRINQYILVIPHITVYVTTMCTYLSGKLHVRLPHRFNKVLKCNILFGNGRQWVRMSCRKLLHSQPGLISRRKWTKNWRM